ncbi:MAG TPA: hypothetical protein VMB74_09470 [Streptosporangiaceae bacterium]|nr:hypothetical protein [Streptosporangiaceae bacterium]
MRRSDEPGFGRSLPDGSDYLAARLARLADAHPASWATASRAGNGRPARADARWGGEPDAWWRGEPDAWWRGPDPSATDAADDDDFAEIDDVDGPGDLGGTAGWGDAADPGGPDEADVAPGRGGGRVARGQTTRRAAGVARSGHEQRDGGWKPHAGPAGAGDDLYRPWFSAGGVGDPWFADGPDPYGPVG